MGALVRNILILPTHATKNQIESEQTDKEEESYTGKGGKAAAIGAETTLQFCSGSFCHATACS